MNNRIKRAVSLLCLLAALLSCLTFAGFAAEV